MGRADLRAAAQPDPTEGRGSPKGGAVRGLTEVPSPTRPQFYEGLNPHFYIIAKRYYPCGGF